MSKSIMRIFIVVLFVIVGPFAHGESTDAARAGKIRAALVYYITKFVQGRNGTNGEKLEVCVIGQDQLSPYLPATFEGKKVAGKTAEVREHTADAANSDGIKGCHIIILGSALENSRRNEVFANLKSIKENLPLTICAVSEVQWGDCMIEIFELNNKARVAIDVEKLELAGFKASSELLEVSVVRGR